MAHDPRAGVARNNCMTLAKGKYLLFLDADDIFEPDMLKHIQDSFTAIHLRLMRNSNTQNYLEGNRLIEQNRILELEIERIKSEEKSLREALEAEKETWINLCDKVYTTFRT